MFCIEGQHLEAALWVQGGEAFSWLLVREEEEKAAMRLATSLKWAAENLFERDRNVPVVVSPRKPGELWFRANRCSRWLLRIHSLEDPAWLFSQGGPGAAACRPSVPARLQPKQLPAGTHTDAHSHFGRQGGGDEGGVVQSSMLRRIISVNEFLFSCKSCD